MRPLHVAGLSLILPLLSNIGLALGTPPAISSIDIAGVSDQNQMGCMPSETAQALIRDLNIDAQSLGGIKNLCDNNDEGKRVLNALLMIRSGQFDATVGHRFVSSDYWAYLTERVHQIVKDSACSPGMIACVHPNDTTVHIGTRFNPASGEHFITQIATLIHEARHTEGYDHVDCSKGPYSEYSRGCDDSFDEGGSYAIEVQYYSRVALHGVNFHPALKVQARLQADYRMKYNFNRVPVAAKQVLFLVDKDDGHLVVFDQGTPTDHSDVVVGSSRMVNEPVYGSVCLLPTDPSAKVQSSINLATLKSEPNAGFNLTRESILDVHWNEDNAGYLFLAKNGVLLLRDQFNGIEKYPVKGPEGESPVEIIDTLPCKLSSGLFVRYQSGRIDAVHIERDRERSIDPDNNAISVSMEKTDCTWPKDLVEITQVASKTIVLDQSGVVSYLGKQGSRQPIPN